MPVAEINRDILAKTDWGGMALKSVSLVLLYIGIVQGEMFGWYDSGLIVSCLLGSVILLLFLSFVHSFLIKHLLILVG